MAFQRDDDKKGLSLPGLIDIIFLLLIFSLVTLSVSESNVDTEVPGKNIRDIDLPETKTWKTDEVPETLNTLMFQIEHADTTSSQKVVYILKPSKNGSVKIHQAREIAMRDSIFAKFPQNFLDMDNQEFSNTRACQMIKNEIIVYKDNHFFEPKPTNSIEIRAVWDTEFRIVNFILETCSALGDTIPRINVRTMSGPGSGYGF
jgi:biopolymer transport protein ExbD